MRRLSRLGVWGTIEVNWLMKAVAISLFLVRVWLLKVMGWLGAMGGSFPRSFLRMVNSWEVLSLCEQVSIVCLHFCRSPSEMSWLICRLSTSMSGLVGSDERSSSR